MEGRALSTGAPSREAPNRIRIGCFLGLPTGPDALDVLVRGAREAEAEGFDTVWMPSGLGIDTLTAATVIARETTTIRIATGVVPTYPRHPIVMAQQAMTAQHAARGRFVLGIGLSHRSTVETRFGYSYDRPARHMREYLQVLGPLVRSEHVSFAGDTVRADATITVDATRVPVLVAAMGSRMLEAAGTFADGTVTWMTGPKTLAGHVIPTIRAAAAAAGRSAPTVVASVPVRVSDDIAGARADIAEAFAVYTRFPSYRSMLDAEGAHGPADIAVVGGESQVRDAIDALAGLGVAELIFHPAGGASVEARTRALLTEIAAASRSTNVSPQG